MTSYKKPSTPSLEDLSADELEILIATVKAALPAKIMLLEDYCCFLDYMAIVESLCAKFIGKDLPRTTSVMQAFLDSEEVRDMGVTKFRGELSKYDEKNQIRKK